jgi:RNA polymerase sigma-70 factor (ECF subfamily)
VPDADPDGERFTALYEEHFARVWAYAASRVGRQSAEEVVSETFALAWRKRRHVPASALPWLLAVARNVTRDYFRRAARGDDLAARLWLACATAAPDVAETVVEHSSVLRALASLSGVDREVLTLVAWHDLSAPDAARVMGCSRATFAVRLHRARRRLERVLRAADDDPPAELAPLAVSKEVVR